MGNEIYTGKLNYGTHAPNTIITVVIPDAIEDGKLCLIYWQWANTADGTKHKNIAFTGKFTKTSKPKTEIRETESWGMDNPIPQYWFAFDFLAHKMQMMNICDVAVGDPIDLKTVYPVSFYNSFSLEYTIS